MSYITEVQLLLVWLVMAEIAAIALTIALMIRKPPPLTTQVDKVTGIKTHGLGRWFALFSLACCCLPLLILVARTAFYVFDLLAPTIVGYWWLPLVVATFGLGGWLLWAWRKPPLQEEAPPVVAEVWQVPPAPPVTGWSLPASVEQWDRRG